MSPWIKRGLVAGNFGIGRPAARLPAEITPVVPAHYSLSEEVDRQHSPGDDTERGSTQKEYGVSGLEEVAAALSSSDTPFFHFDLTSAVRVAELSATSDLTRASEEYKQKL